MKFIHCSLLAAALVLSAPAHADVEDQRYYEQHKAQLLSVEAAKKKALSIVPNAKYVKEIEFEREEMMQPPHFDIEVIDQAGAEHDIKLHAKTGEVLKNQRSH